jgi:hypothetical protein
MRERRAERREQRMVKEFDNVPFRLEHKNPHTIPLKSAHQ